MIENHENDEMNRFIDPETQNKEPQDLMAGDTDFAMRNHNVKSPPKLLTAILFYVSLFVTGWGCNAFLTYTQSSKSKDYGSYLSLLPYQQTRPKNGNKVTDSGNLEFSSHEPAYNSTQNNTESINDDSIPLSVDSILFREGDEYTVNEGQDLYDDYDTLAENFTYTSKKHNENKNSSGHTLTSHTYSNCPLTMAKFSQFELGREGPFESDIDRLTNSFDRGNMALDFSNEHRTYERVVAALKSGAFDERTIVMEGDSLTRQLFISLSCLIWSAGYVDNYDFDQNDVEIGGSNHIMNNVHYEASSNFIARGAVHLHGGGQIHYVANPESKKILDDEVNVACNPTSEPGKKAKFKVRYNFDWKMKGFRPMLKRDLHILAAGHHEDRESYLAAYEQIYKCKSDEANAEKFRSIPHMMYQLSSVESFWTTNGLYQSKFLEGADRMTCRANTKTFDVRNEERRILRGLVPLIGDTIDLEHLGQLHVWHGDCLHWLQPGIPDLYAAEVADYLLSTKP